MKTGEEILETLQHGVEIQKRLNQKWFSEEEFIEALDIIERLVVQSCAIDDKGGHVSELDSMGIWDYADALHYLAKHGRLIILKESGKRVIAKLALKS